MKALSSVLFLCILSINSQAQNYQATNTTDNRIVQVPCKTAKGFNKQYPSASVDSCYLFENTDQPKQEYRFYAKHNRRIVEATFDNHGKPIELKIETPVEEMPEPLRQILTRNDVGAERVGKAYKLTTWLPKQKKSKRRKKLPKRTKTEYMVEFFADYNGKKLKVPMYFNESGYQANPGFR